MSNWWSYNRSLLHVLDWPYGSNIISGHWLSCTGCYQHLLIYEIEMFNVWSAVSTVVHLPRMFPPTDFLFEKRIGLVSMALLYIILTNYTQDNQQECFRIIFHRRSLYSLLLRHVTLSRCHAYYKIWISYILSVDLVSPPMVIQLGAWQWWAGGCCIRPNQSIAAIWVFILDMLLSLVWSIMILFKN